MALWRITSQQTLIIFYKFPNMRQCITMVEHNSFVVCQLWQFFFNRWNTTNTRAWAFFKAIQLLIFIWYGLCYFITFGSWLFSTEVTAWWNPYFINRTDITYSRGKTLVSLEAESLANHHQNLKQILEARYREVMKLMLSINVYNIPESAGINLWNQILSLYFEPWNT